MLATIVVLILLGGAAGAMLTNDLTPLRLGFAAATIVMLAHIVVKLQQINTALEQLP